MITFSLERFGEGRSIGVILGEFMAASIGLGFMIQHGSNHFNIARSNSPGRPFESFFIRRIPDIVF
jgi:hypothetical protein